MYCRRGLGADGSPLLIIDVDADEFAFWAPILAASGFVTTGGSPPPLETWLLDLRDPDVVVLAHPGDGHTLSALFAPSDDVAVWRAAVTRTHECATFVGVGIGAADDPAALRPVP